MEVLLLIVPFVAIVLYETPEMIREKRWHDLAIFSAITLFGFIVSLLQVIGIKIPNPLKYIKLILIAMLR